MTAAEYTAVMTPLFDRHKVPQKLRPVLVRYFCDVNADTSNLEPHRARLWCCINECRLAVGRYGLHRLYWSGSKKPPAAPDPHAVPRSKPLNWSKMLKPVFDRHRVPTTNRPVLTAYLTTFEKVRPAGFDSCIADCEATLAAAVLKASVLPSIRAKLERAA